MQMLGVIMHRLSVMAVTIPAWQPRWPGADGLGAVAGMLALGLWASVMMSDTDGRAERSAGPARSGTEGSEIASAPEWMTGPYFGVPYTHPSDMRFLKDGKTDLTVHGINWDGKPFKSPIYYGIRSVRWSGMRGAMVDFTHSKTISQPGQTVRFSGTRDGKPAPGSATIGDTFKHLEFSHGHNTLTLNGMMRLGSLGLRLGPYIGGGFGVALPHTEIQFKDEAKRTYEYQYAGPAGQALVGIEIRLPRVTLFVEYKFTLARMSAPLTGIDSRGWGYGDIPQQFLRWLRGDKPENGVATTTLASHQVVGGFGIRSTAAPELPAR